METTDWNWFFSSLAQSAAAIVGIFGAFIVTKILANQGAFAEKSRRIQELIAAGQKIADAASRLSFEWYHRYTSLDELDDLEDLLEKDSTLGPETLYQSLAFSPYLPRADVLTIIARAKANREQHLAREKEEARRASEQAGPFAAFRHSMSSKVFQQLDRSHLRPKLQREREGIDALYTEARHHVRLVSDFYTVVATNPESSRTITWSLTLILTLFFVGVIYSLSFMPLPINWKPALSLSEVPNFLLSLRGALLAAVSLIFSAMLAMFFVMNLRLRYDPVLLEQLAGFRKIGAYSSFFEHRETNATLRTENES
jgi:hypothetical protein